MMKARVTVTLKNGVLDPQGKAIASGGLVNNQALS
jgi:phosphoribosylformylglycinamidine (FGAM) synthase PurS component